MGAQQITQVLLDDVKTYLGITWQDGPTDRKIRGYIASGMVYLDSKCGGAADYETEGLPKTLLCEYVRYIRDAALDVFEENYRSMILAMRHERTVIAHAEKTVQDAER